MIDPPRALCRVEDIPDPGARGFTFGDGRTRREIFVVRQGDRVFGYENACPHIGTPLDFLPDQFLTRDRRHLLCATHGARFEIATGLCIAGPCRGRSLARVALRIDAGAIFLAAAGGTRTATFGDN